MTPTNPQNNQTDIHPLPATLSEPWSNPDCPSIQILNIHIPKPETITSADGFIVSPDKLIIKSGHVEFILHQQKPESQTAASPSPRAQECTIGCDGAGMLVPVTVSATNPNGGSAISEKEVESAISLRTESPPPLVGSRLQDVFLDDSLQADNDVEAVEGTERIEVHGMNEPAETQTGTLQLELLVRNAANLNGLEESTYRPPLPPRKSNSMQEIQKSNQSQKDDLEKLTKLAPQKVDSSEERVTKLPPPKPEKSTSRPPLPPRKPNSKQDLPRSNESKNVKIDGEITALAPPSKEGIIELSPPASVNLEESNRPEPLLARIISGVKCSHPELLALPETHWDFAVDTKTMRIFYKNSLTGARSYAHPTLGALPKHWIFRVEKTAASGAAPERVQIRMEYFQRVEKMGWAGDPRDPWELAAFHAEVLRKEHVRLQREREVRMQVEDGMMGAEDDRLIGVHEGSEMVEELNRKARRARQLAVKFGEQVKATSVGGTITVLGVK